MRLRRRTLDKFTEKHTTIIAEGIHLKGEVKGKNNIILHGQLDGKIELSGILLLGKTGRINGETKARSVIIEGNATGNITATEKVEIRDGGKYKGDIVANSIVVSEKAILEGNVKMKVQGKGTSVKQFTEKRSPQKPQNNSHQ